MSKEEKKKIVENFFLNADSIFDLKESDFANKESMPYYEIIMYFQNSYINQIKNDCPNINDMILFCADNNSNQLSDQWKNKWLSMTKEQQSSVMSQCYYLSDITKAKTEICDKDVKAEYSFQKFKQFFDNDDLIKLKNALLDQDVDLYIDSNGKINDINKVFQNTLEYVVNESALFNKSEVMQQLKQLFGNEFNVNINTVIYFADNFFKVANELSASINKSGGMRDDNHPMMLILNELKNRYLNHITELKSKTIHIINNLESVSIKDFESTEHAPYYNEVKNIGGSYTFDLFTTFLPEAKELFSNLKQDMVKNPEDYFNVDGKLIDKKRKLINQINYVLNKSESCKQKFKDFFNLLNKPSLELAVSIIRQFQPNMPQEDRIKIAKQLEIEQTMKEAALKVKVGGNNKNRLKSIRKILKKHQIRKILSKNRK